MQSVVMAAVCQLSPTPCGFGGIQELQPRQQLGLLGVEVFLGDDGSAFQGGKLFNHLKNVCICLSWVIRAGLGFRLKSSGCLRWEFRW